MHNFKKLNIWINAMILAKEIYRITASYPKEERYGLVSQMNRCSISVASNIAEGSSRSSAKEFTYFLKVALGSLFELETQVILSHDFEMISTTELVSVNERITTLQKMLNGFIAKFNRQL